MIQGSCGDRACAELSVARVSIRKVQQQLYSLDAREQERLHLHHNTTWAFLEEEGL